MYEVPKNTHEILDKARSLCDKNQLTEEERRSLEDRVFKPFIRIDYFSEGKTKEVIEGENKLSYSEVELGEDDLIFLSKYIESDGMRSSKKYLPKASEWFAVDQLNYSIGKNDFDIFSKLPAGYKILFCPQAEMKTGAVCIEAKRIIIAGDLGSIGSLGTILHEIGHVKDRENLDQLGKIDFVKGGEIEECIAAEKLRKEQEASFFAMREMESLLEVNPQFKADIVLYLKNMAYHSHCLDSFEKLENSRNLKSSWHGDMSEYEYSEEEQDRDESFSMWCNFKKTPEYLEWKKIPKFALITEDEEWGKWDEWIKETGKFYDEKFRKQYP